MRHRWIYRGTDDYLNSASRVRETCALCGAARTIIDTIPPRIVPAQDGLGDCPESIVTAAVWDAAVEANRSSIAGR